MSHHPLCIILNLLNLFLSVVYKGTQMELTFQNNQEYVITLKEITDLIGVRHDKSMAKVEELAIENGFGTLSKIDIVYNDKGQTIPTYRFTKKQAIAVAARLNNAMLMKVINRLEELEKAKPQFQIPQTLSEALLLAGTLAKQIEEQTLQLELQQPKVAFYEAVTGSSDTIDIGEAAKVLNIKGIGRNNLFQLLEI